MRKILRDSLRVALEKTWGKPFDFGTGLPEHISSESCKLPLAWVCPFELIGKTGRSEGAKTYAATICLFESSEGLLPEEKDDAWDAMEHALLNALDEVIETTEAVVAYDKIKCLPQEGAYPGLNGLSLKVTFEVKVNYCQERE